ncbi:TIGR03560 family F420-dependent LLM class oxidoreductase [Mycolicibacterium aubagnense]|uniref:LLM class F420-dependent oxidoreductase n=1 Tax=Mycolicibacterium aubagnense TaxID=319707 RepID=A0ABM7IKJ1_9MYCO|nr:TIGR03560 family F420-dependent LLM class oxidoreductase [Mycolicibacterium aubagnense]BBX87209.1 LLM class F420-dependent oxidoreductase [Mycolicibacterium aubagnense]
METGIHFVDFLPGAPEKLGPTLAAVARTAEQAGATMFTLADHFFQMEAVDAPAENPFLEGYTSLGFLAAQTETIDLSLLVTGVTYRYPGILAKIVATLDVLSQDVPCSALARRGTSANIWGSVCLSPLARRFEMLEETLQICAQMWSADDGPYRGRHYQLAETICQPQPIRRPPIVIGGDGEKKTLRLVAQYADVWNSVTEDAEVLKHKIDVLRRHCDATGRDPREIRMTLGLGHHTEPFTDPAAFMRDMESYAALGIDMVNIGIFTGIPDPVGYMARIGEEVIPRLTSLG